MPKLIMNPGTGERLVRFVGDRLVFELKVEGGGASPPGWRAVLRTNIGRATLLREEIIEAYARNRPPSGCSWRDIPMEEKGRGWSLELCLSEVGLFRAKAYAVDVQGFQHWPEGPDAGVTCHPDDFRSGNTIYCAFTRMFGSSKTASATHDDSTEEKLKALEAQGYATIPPSGKLRDLVQELPHIVDTLGCRILHLLPVNPTPTTFARFGRFGSPYAALDFTAIDPALVVFDRRTTGTDQFCELAYATHRQGARLFLDVAINHTGWNSRLQEEHPEWFLRRSDGLFVSPGAWGVTWEDLVEFNHRDPSLAETLAQAFLEWCRRGVDGFRCDAGYQVPVVVWQYLVARVRQEFPETLFLLEGLGGSWEATEQLLGDGGMQWAYSELFQNRSSGHIATYLDHCIKQNERVGVLVHYSETHDNDRLAKRGRAWSLLRNRLCALTSAQGAFGFTCGVEWLATERVEVHQSRGLAWGSPDNLVPELARLNRLLCEHPCFFDGARLTRLSAIDAPVYALERRSADGCDCLMVLVNTDLAASHGFVLAARAYEEMGRPQIDLLGQTTPPFGKSDSDEVIFEIDPGACFCLGVTTKPRGLSGNSYRHSRARAAWATTVLSQSLPPEAIGPCDWKRLSEMVDDSPERFLAAVAYLDRKIARAGLEAALEKVLPRTSYPSVINWSLADRTRITLVPPDHWVLVRDDFPFRARLCLSGNSGAEHVESVHVGTGHVACFWPRRESSEAELELERYGPGEPRVRGAVRFLAAMPAQSSPSHAIPARGLVLLTNGIGGMARMSIDLGRIESKYDCLLGANLHATVPVDRHIFAKRVRLWANADGFITPLDLNNLAAFDAGPPACWRFAANAGDGRTVEIFLRVAMIAGSNTTVLRLNSTGQSQFGDQATSTVCKVRVTARLDIEDRNFHTETRRSPSAEFHFRNNCHPLGDRAGFRFAPAADRQVWVFSDAGDFHPHEEWCMDISHAIENERGQTSSGDAYSPGWFDLPLAASTDVTLVVSADAEPPVGAQFSGSLLGNETSEDQTRLAFKADPFGNQLARALRAFVVRRGGGKTIIAGYPWFLDWGRDSLICARGLLAAGMGKEVEELLTIFGGFEDRGTLPNSIHGQDTSNRDTSDAPLWYGLVCEEAAALSGEKLYMTVVDRGGRTIAQVLADIGEFYRRGVPNGIRVDPDSGLVWSPAHFTWMDTNHPAGTPREGYPIEIQILWIRLLRQLDRLGIPATETSWQEMAERAVATLLDRFWIEERGYFSDLLIANRGQSARVAIQDNALRSNCLLAVSLGLVTGDKARRTVQAALRHLVVPGALRSLAPLPVSPPLAIYGGDGRLLNNPYEPYWGVYAGDEDTRRKPAYHNGTAWVWTFPTFCEALARAWDLSPAAVAAATSYLGSLQCLMTQGCIGQLPEILDGDTPHRARGCDAQAWSASEALRVWKLLREIRTTEVGG